MKCVTNGRANNLLLGGLTCSSSQWHNEASKLRSTSSRRAALAGCAAARSGRCALPPPSLLLLSAAPAEPSACSRDSSPLLPLLGLTFMSNEQPAHPCNNKDQNVTRTDLLLQQSVTSARMVSGYD